MKTYQTLKEENGSFTPERIVDEIIENCQPFLKEADYLEGRGLDNLNRGMDSNRKITIKSTRFDRKGLAMPEDEKEILDDAMMQVFGYPFRSKVVFTSGNSKRVELFGTPFVIFPIGEFTYLWSSEVSDLNEFDDWLKMSKQGLITHESAVAFLKESGYKKDEGLPAAIESGHEIMVGVDQYYAIEKEFFLEEVKSILIKTLKEGKDKK